MAVEKSGGLGCWRTCRGRQEYTSLEYTSLVIKSGNAIRCLTGNSFPPPGLCCYFIDAGRICGWLGADWLYVIKELLCDITCLVKRR